MFLKMCYEIIICKFYINTRVYEMNSIHSLMKSIFSIHIVIYFTNSSLSRYNQGLFIILECIFPFNYL